MADRKHGWALALVVCTLSACGSDRARPMGEEGDAGAEQDVVKKDAATKPPPVDACPASNPLCRVDNDKPAPTCANAAINLDPVGVNVMIAIDGSASMAPHWDKIKDAVQKLHDAHPEANFGIHVFFGKIQADFQGARDKANWCGATDNTHFLDVAANTATQLTEVMGAMPPGPPSFFGIWETSPVIDPLDYYVVNATKLADPTRTNYLLLVTDGNDNCFGSIYSNNQDKLLAYEKIAVELSKRDIRVLPIGFDAVSAATYNGSYFTTPPTTNFEALSTLLKYGGTGLSEVPKVENAADFAQVLDQVGLRVRSCRFSVPKVSASQDVNPFDLTFTVNGTPIMRDRTNTNGWNFVGGDIQQVELFGDACEAVRSGKELKSQKSCAGDTCGNAAVEVQTKPRAVLFLLDSSASRISCTDGSPFNCTATVGQPNRTSFTYWETVEHTLGESLVEPINDDVEFGLQLFPSKAQNALNCDVATMPEIPPAQGAQIQIMSTMMEKLPLGLSPVLQALESVAAAPGRLAEPGVQGAVVMLTDGGDNCAGVSQDELLVRFGAAAKSLLDKNVKTYVVRYGAPGGNSPEQEAQLRAIVASGGTARSDPADMTMTPYIDAKSDAELNAALAELSDKLSSCEIAVGMLDPKADITKANLYLNGSQIPQVSPTKQDGWDWKPNDPTVIELHGPSCDEFKTSRKTSVIVEFGCMPLIVI